MNVSLNVYFAANYSIFSVLGGVILSSVTDTFVITEISFILKKILTDTNPSD